MAVCGNWLVDTAVDGRLYGRGSGWLVRSGQ